MSDILIDPLEIDAAYPPDMHSLFIENRLLGLVFLANGRGPHPTVILLHGFPGNEKNLDVAHMLRRGGYNVLVFHYSGSWGSRGSYSFGQAYRDLQAARSAVGSEAFAREHRIDRSRVYLAGHSVGGFLTMLAARDQLDFVGFASLAPYNLSLQAKRIEAGEAGVMEETLGLLSGGLNPLSGASAESLFSEVMENREKWDLLGSEAPYRGKKILLVVASSDIVAPPAIHHLPLAETIARASDRGTVVTLECSHDFSEKRVTLGQTLFDWLES